MIQLRFRYLVLVLGFCLLGVVESSAALESNVADFSRVTRRWGVDEGLTGARAEQVLQTPEGHLWVGGEDGLFHFNGRRFDRIDPTLVPELGHRWVRQMCLDSDGVLWLHTSNGGIARLTQGTFHGVVLPEEFPNLVHWNAHPEGGVLAALRGPGGTIMARLTKSGVESISESLEGSLAASLATDDGKVWLAFSGAPIAELHDGVLIPGEVGAGLDTAIFWWPRGDMGCFNVAQGRRSGRSSLRAKIPMPP
ncbi:hypothetical protein N9230_04310 [Akkermansiaceae bacterium]|nr:hypothetical protein [Akkermansiaceae bacterium]